MTRPPGILRRAVPALAALVAGLVVGGGVPLAAAAFDAANADKVDGRHAVGAAATASARAGKLVATTSAGVLPGAIIARAPNSIRLDGLAATAYQRRVSGTCPTGTYISAVGPAGGVGCSADRVSGGNAQTLDGQDSATLEPSTSRTVFVRRVGSAAQNGAALLSAVATIPTTGPDAATLANSWRVEIEPGRFDLDDQHLLVPNYVTLSGSGPSTVLISVGEGTPIEASVVSLGTASELHSLTIRNNGPGAATGVHLRSAFPRISDVDIVVDGAPAYGIRSDVEIFGNLPIINIHDVDITVTTADLGYGINLLSRARIRDAHVKVTSTSQSDNAIGIVSRNATTISDVSVHAMSATTTNLYGVQNSGGTTVRDSSVVVDGPAADRAFLNSSGSLRIANTLLGGTVLGSAPTCVGAYTAAYVPLSVTCS